jgi:site-specific DNA-cytosine methylase
MENVPEIMTAGAEILAGVIRFLESNYLVKVGVLAARDFGVPQRRRRAFLIGVRATLLLIWE